MINCSSGKTKPRNETQDTLTHYNTQGFDSFVISHIIHVLFLFVLFFLQVFQTSLPLTASGESGFDWKNP